MSGTSRTIIDSLVAENEELARYLRESGEISLLSAVENSFRKFLLLAVASYFEDMTKRAVVELTDEYIGRQSPPGEFVKRKGVERQYHT
jgi:hypothetical protein